MNTEEIDWRQNCLVGGVHNGRPEAIWKLPLMYAATVLFSKDALKEIVISRIYNDAMMISEHNDKYPKAWADRVKAIAEERYDSTLQHKVGELSTYYKESRVKKEYAEIAHLVTENRLNPRYEPLHGHDTINLLCRIIGVGATGTADKEFGI
jgi:hypothetical protein